MAALLAICASVIFGVADFFGGMSARRIAPLITAAMAQLAGLLVLLVIGLAVLGGEPIGNDLAIGALAGAIGGAAIGAFYFALSRGAMSVVAPISAVTSAVVPILAGLLLGESPGLVRWFGIALSLPAILLISREGTAEPVEQASEPVEERATPASNRVGVLAGLAAGVGFGLFVAIITRTSDASGVWPLVSSRSTSAILLGVALLATRPYARSTGGTPDTRAGLRLALFAGMLDGTSNMFILEAGRRGMLVLVGVIGAMYPASTILLARVVLDERLQRHQLMGLALGVTAVVFIAM